MKNNTDLWRLEVINNKCKIFINDLLNYYNKTLHLYAVLWTCNITKSKFHDVHLSSCLTHCSSMKGRSMKYILAANCKGFSLYNHLYETLYQYFCNNYSEVNISEMAFIVVTHYRAVIINLSVFSLLWYLEYFTYIASLIYMWMKLLCQMLWCNGYHLHVTFGGSQVRILGWRPATFTETSHNFLSLYRQILKY